MDSLFLYSYLHLKLRNHCRSNIVSISEMKEVFGRILLRNGGLPRFMIKYIIEDMEKLGLIKFICKQTGYTILEDPNEKEVRRLLFID